MTYVYSYPQKYNICWCLNLQTGSVYALCYTLVQSHSRSEYVSRIGSQWQAAFAIMQLVSSSYGKVKNRVLVLHTYTYNQYPY